MNGLLAGGLHQPHAWVRSCRSALVLLGILAVCLWAALGAAVAQADQGDGQRVGKNYLMVADPGASRVYFYRVPGMRLTGTLRGVTLGSAGDPARTPMHGGAIVLPDGRILVNDETHQRTLAIKLNNRGAPRIVNSVASKLGDESPWNAVDPEFRYYAVSSNGGGTVGPSPAPGKFQTGSEFLNLIDLKTFENTQVEIPMNNVGEDLTPFFGGDPLTLFEAVGGGEVRAFNVASLLAGDTTPTSSFTEVGPNMHGGFSSPVTGKIGLTTGPQPPNIGSGPTATPNPDNKGMDVMDVACGGGEDFCGVEGEGSLVGPCDPSDLDCPSLVDLFTVPWNADGLTLSKGNRVRVMADGAHVMTPLNVDLTPGIATDWQKVRLDAHVTDLWTYTARRINVGVGATSRGFPVSTKYAVEPVIRPRRARGRDLLKIIDVRPDSPTYLTVVRTVKLAQMTNGPVAGIAPTYPTYERRFAAITPDGRYAFVTRGGDAKVDMVDTKSGAVTTVAVPSSLTGGGHATALQVGFEPFDLSGR